jgi:hypothetical protein
VGIRVHRVAGRENGGWGTDFPIPRRVLSSPPGPSQWGGLEGETPSAVCLAATAELDFYGLPAPAAEAQEIEQAPQRHVEGQCSPGPKQTPAEDQGKEVGQG